MKINLLVISFVYSITDLVGMEESLIVICIDFNKAFDTILHNFPTRKPSKCGLDTGVEPEGGVVTQPHYPFWTTL